MKSVTFILNAIADYKRARGPGARLDAVLFTTSGGRFPLRGLNIDFNNEYVLIQSPNGSQAYFVPFPAIDYIELRGEFIHELKKTISKR